MICPSTSRPVRIAVIEDDAEFREELLSTLGGAADGYPSFASYATRRSEPARYDVLVLDLTLPDMDGFEAILALASDPTPPCLIVVSGATAALIAEATKLAGAVNIQVLASLRKPIEPGELVAALQRPITPGTGRPKRPTIGDGEIGSAFARNDMTLNYQLQVDLGTARPVGAEALLRFSETGTLAVSPGEVVAALIRIGQSRALDDWALATAFGDLAAFRVDAPDFGVSVNLSATPLSADLPDRIERAAAQAGLDPRAVTVEVTETTVLEADSATIACLARIRLHGFGLSLDDFGVGTSNIDRLMSSPFSEIKLDRSLIGEARRSSAARSLVRAVTAIAGEREALVVAEGVESQRDLDLVRSLGCHRGQGFLFSRAVPARSLSRLLAPGPRRSGAAP